jgi:hypothetical protein
MQLRGKKENVLALNSTVELRATIVNLEPWRQQRRSNLTSAIRSRKLRVRIALRRSVMRLWRVFVSILEKFDAILQC